MDVLGRMSRMPGRAPGVLIMFASIMLCSWFVLS